MPRAAAFVLFLLCWLPRRTATLLQNFEVERTSKRDLEEHFRPYGRLVRTQIKRNYAFVEYETVAEVRAALSLSAQNPRLSVPP